MGGSTSDRDVGDEAQPALVDAHQRHVVARQLARDAQHGAVAAHHHREVAAPAEFVGVERVEVGDTGGLCGLALERHFKALRDQEMRHVLQHGPDAACLVLPDDGGMAEAAGHAADYTIGHPCGRPPAE